MPSYRVQVISIICTTTFVSSLLCSTILKNFKEFQAYWIIQYSQICDFLSDNPCWLVSQYVHSTICAFETIIWISKRMTFENEVLLQETAGIVSSGCWFVAWNCQFAVCHAPLSSAVATSTIMERFKINSSPDVPVSIGWMRWNQPVLLHIFKRRDIIRFMPGNTWIDMVHRKRNCGTSQRVGTSGED